MAIFENISEMVYLDGFARICYPAEIQEDEDEELIPVEDPSRTCYPAGIQDDEDEQLIPAKEPSNPLSDGVPERDTPMQQVTPFDDGSGAFTPQEREQLILEEMALPGAPKQEEERRRSWRTHLGSHTSLAQGLGHLPGHVLEAVLRQSRAPPEFF